MTAPLILYSANIGGYDRGPELHPDTDRVDMRVLFSDVPVERPGWRNVIVPAHFADPKRTVSYLKARPDLLFGDEAATIWADGSLHGVRVDARNLAELVAPPGVVVAAPPHRQRNTLRAEAEAVIALGLDTPEAVARAVAVLDAMGFPDRSGLATGMFIYRDLRDARVRAGCAAWLRMMMLGSRRDQLSFTAAFWSAGLGIHAIPVPWGRPNELFAMRPHRRPTHRRLGDAADHSHPAFMPVPEGFAEEAWTHDDLSLLRDLAALPIGPGAEWNLLWGGEAPPDPAFALPSPALSASRQALRAAARAARIIQDDSDRRGIHAALCLLAHPEALVAAALPEAVAHRLRLRFGDRLRPALPPGAAPDLVLLGRLEAAGGRAAPAGGATVLLTGPAEGAAARALRADGWRIAPPSLPGTALHRLARE